MSGIVQSAVTDPDPRTAFPGNQRPSDPAMTAQPQQHEHVLLYAGDAEQRLQLVQTIAAMANTLGGTIHISRVEGDRQRLETAAVAGLASGFVAPRVRGIESSLHTDGSVVIQVPESETKPHVITRDGMCADADGWQRSVFHTGQVWVRRGRENRPAGPDDLQQMVRESASQLLEHLSIGLRDPAFSLKLTDSQGIPVRLAEDEGSVPVSPNLARLYPYTTKTLAGQLDKPTNWVATAGKVLRLKESRENAYGVPAPSGRVVQWRYSDRALRLLRDQLAKDPAWNPYRAL